MSEEGMLTSSAVEVTGNPKKDDEVAIAFPPDAASLTSLLLSGMRVREVTVFVKESRQRAQYITAERALSENVDFRKAWADTDSLEKLFPDRKSELYSAFGAAMTQRIMQVENYLYERIVHMQRKDGVLVWERDAGNPYVQNPYDYQTAKKQAQGK
jgi:hypothetical protein